MVKSSKNNSRKHRGGNEPALEEQSKTTVEHLQKNLQHATGKAKEKMQQLLQYFTGLAKTTESSVKTSDQQVESKVMPVVSAPVQQVKSVVVNEPSNKRTMLPSHFQSKGGAKKSQKKHKSMKKKKSKKKHKSMKKRTSSKK